MNNSLDFRKLRDYPVDIHNFDCNVSDMVTSVYIGPQGTLLRVRDEDAVKIVNNKEASYAPKSEWKELRDTETNNNKEKDNAKD